MKNFVSVGENVNVTAPYALTPGQGCLVGTIFGVATATVAAGANTDIRVEGEFVLDAPSTLVAAAGAVAYWNDTTRTLDTTGTPIGNYSRAKANGDTSAYVRLEAGIGAGGGITSSGAVDFVVFAGQSQTNSNGTTGNDVPGTHTAALPNVMTWDPWQNQWVTYQAGVTSGVHTNSGKYANNTQYWGGEAEYAKQYVAANPGKTLYIVKMAFSSTSIDPAARTANRGCWDPALRLELYDFLIRAVNAARADLHAQGKSVNVRAFIWVQGENEGGNSTAAGNYQTTLTNFFTAVRRDANLQSTPFLISRINSIAAWTSGAAIRSAQVAVGDSTPNVRWINCDDLTLAADNVHYGPTTTGVIEHGRREYLATITAAEAYAAYVAKLAFTPNTLQKSALMDLFQGLIERSLFATLDCMQLYCMPDQVSALANLVPTTITPANSGMTFTAKSGFTGTSANSFINTGIAQAGARTMKQNDTALSIWIGNNITAASGVDMGSFAGGAGVSVLTVNPSASGNFRVNNNTAVTADNTITVGSDVSGLWTMQRDGATSSKTFQNGFTAKTDAVNGSGTPSPTPIFVGNRSLTVSSGTAGTTGRLYQAFAAGSSRTTAQEQALYSILSTFLLRFPTA